MGRLTPVPQKRSQPPFHGSTRYYRGRIVQALRDLPAGGSIATKKLYASLGRQAGRPSAPNCDDGLDEARYREIVASLRRDGLVRVTRGRVRLP